MMMMMMIFSGQKYTLGQMDVVTRPVHSQTTWRPMEGGKEIRPRIGVGDCLGS